MVDFTLLGHSCPSGKYPAIVLPVGRRHKKLVVLYQGAEGDSQEEEISEDHEFVRYKTPLRAPLSNFDPSLQRLFAYSSDSVVTYNKDVETEFFRVFLSDKKYLSVDPFVRFSFAHLAGDRELLVYAIGDCLQLLAEQTPRFSATWAKNEAVRALRSIEENVQKKSRETNGRRLLIVDDDPATTENFRAPFANHGYSVKTAGSGSEALQIARVWQPHVIILDLGMPDMNGMEFIIRLRAQNFKIPVVILSGNDDLIAEQRTDVQGVTKILRKPAKLQELIEVVDSSGTFASFH